MPAWGFLVLQYKLMPFIGQGRNFRYKLYLNYISMVK